MEGILWQETMSSLKIALVVMCVFVPTIASIILARYFLVDKRVKRNCLDCRFADKKSQPGKMHCKHPIPIAFQRNTHPYVWLKMNGALYSSADNGQKALAGRCTAWQWDSIYKNLKKKGVDLVTFGN